LRSRFGSGSIRFLFVPGLFGVVEPETLLQIRDVVILCQSCLLVLHAAASSSNIDVSTTPLTRPFAVEISLNFRTITGHLDAIVAVAGPSSRAAAAAAITTRRFSVCPRRKAGICGPERRGPEPDEAGIVMVETRRKMVWEALEADVHFRTDTRSNDHDVERSR
jgi:hypothetical protein